MSLVFLDIFQIKKGFSDGLDAALDHYKEKSFTHAWDGLQKEVLVIFLLKCCGCCHCLDTVMSDVQRA